MRFITAVLAASVLFSAAADAQPKGKRDWHEKMKSEKIAFITTELGKYGTIIEVDLSDI